MPGVAGQEEARAAATLGGAGFVPHVVSAVTTDASKVGVVLKQSPAAGHRARKGSAVTLTVGKLGTPTTTTPTTPTTPITPTTPTTSTTPAPPSAAAGPAP